MLERRYLPDPGHLSVLTATILLSYALGRFIDLPGRELSLQLPGIYLELQLNVRTAIALLVAGLTATGAEWLLRQHPAVSHHSTLEHWLLPALTALVIGVPLFQLPLGVTWWAGFVISGVLIMLVLIAEYITIDPTDMRHPAAAAGLTALSFALYLVLAITLRAAGSRLFQMIPALGLAVFLVSVRSLHLRLHGRWAFLQAGIISLCCIQLAAGLHYLPLSPVSFGLALIGPAYALTSLTADLIQGVRLRQALLEPAVVLILVLGTALWIR